MTDNPTSLYTAWLDALPRMFGAMLLPAAGSSAQDAPAAADAAKAAEASSSPFPTDQVAKAMKGLDGILKELYQAYLPLSAQGPPAAGPIKAFAEAGAAMYGGMLQGLGGAGASPQMPAWTGLARAAEPWSLLVRGLLPTGEARAADEDALRTGLERAFGGLADAFGLGPLRELESAWRDTLHAAAERQRAQAEYLALLVEAWNEGTRQLLERLGAMATRGERVESLLAFLRAWARAVDGPLHDAMQGERGLAVTASLMRATTRHREQMQKTVELVSEALHLPTRAEVDEAYREIQQLKRELRRLRKSLPQAAVGPSQPQTPSQSDPAEEQQA